MNKSTKQDPLMQDLELYAQELDATLTVPHFVKWLLENRPQLARIDPKALEGMAAESLYSLAHIEPAPPES